MFKNYTYLFLPLIMTFNIFLKENVWLSANYAEEGDFLL